ncbi:MAG: hypothetical protein U5P41_11415 [Gammaproteobacteria bacterium]|nr:hypothetical protein [Gammaproteobacteria bacterium]
MKNAFLNTTTRECSLAKEARMQIGDELSMKPPFQRNPSLGLIGERVSELGAILSGLPIPEVYMQDTISADGEARYIVSCNCGSSELELCYKFL